MNKIDKTQQLKNEHSIWKMGKRQTFPEEDIQTAYKHVEKMFKVIRKMQIETKSRHHNTPLRKNKNKSDSITCCTTVGKGNY